MALYRTFPTAKLESSSTGINIIATINRVLGSLNKPFRRDPVIPILVNEKQKEGKEKKKKKERSQTEAQVGE